VVDSIDEEVDDAAVDRDVIADFISDVTHYDAGPENITQVASRLAAAGWPLAGVADFSQSNTSPEVSNSEAATSEAAS
jgi:Protein of unknown function (DUF3349)